MNKKKTIIITSALILLFSLITVYVHAACSASPAYTKGNCDFGQICAGGECKWADRDFDGFPNYDFCRRLLDGSHNCDCDDYDPEVHPGAIERCNYKDDNCNGIEVVTDTDSCTHHDSDWQAYFFYMIAYRADCGLRDAVYAGHGCEAGDGTYTDYGNYIDFLCPPAPHHQANFWFWKCCKYNVTETGEGIDEGDVCQKTVHICDEKPFLNNECDGKTWCKDEDATRDEGECEYTAEEEYLGINEFNVYFCDENDCYKFVKGTFQICGYGWQCTAICFPGDCNFETKEWCNNEGIWQTEEWCHNECGRSDSDCGGNCKEGTCDLHAKKVCKLFDDKGYWVDENYCDCDVCGSIDSSCPTGCSCEDKFCDIENEAYCKDTIWDSTGYCLFEEGKCCEEDYNCRVLEYACDCKEGACDTTHNKHCLSEEWVSDNYCDDDTCGPYDFDCGAEPCIDRKCDIISKTYCDKGIWKSVGEKYCYPGYCGLQDPSCECSNKKDNCCLGENDDICDYDCFVDSDLDCLVCTSSQGDCCDDTPDGTCDLDCIPKVDPDCCMLDPECECSKEADDCCSNLDDGNCDPDCTENSDTNCEGVCTEKRGDCCLPDNDRVCDPDCITGVDPDCAAHPCDENWICEEWDKDCDGVHDTHTCLNWIDTNDCNTFFHKPEETQNCYKEFTCGPEDDSDEDEYPERACYDAIKDEVLDEIDCDDNDALQNPEGEEICNGEDDNCDDSIDEGCPCVGGTTQDCGRDVGVCRTGLQLCIGGYWSICGGSGYVAPSKETCDDGLDNNCDSYIDENCKCAEGQKQDCGIEIGICKKGWQACYNGSFGSVCNDEVKGVTEICNNNIDDDCDGTLDGDDSNCQVTTPVTTGPEHCKNRIQDAGETGVDCGDDKDCLSCTEKPAACSYGIIDKKCTCGAAAYNTGYCCNGKYSLAECIEPVKDSDDDGCNDDKELQIGTDVRNSDTDGDTLLDCDIEEKHPLCNEDGSCDVEREYPETLENCPSDCGKGVGWLTWLVPILIILGLLGVGGYFYAKKKGYNIQDILKKIRLSNFIKIKKKEEKPAFQFKVTKGTPPTAQPTPETVKPEKKRDIIKLREFTNNAIKKGYTKLQVKQAALKSGWSEQEVDIVLKGKKSRYKFFK